MTSAKIKAFETAIKNLTLLTLVVDEDGNSLFDDAYCSAIDALDKIEENN